MKHPSLINLIGKIKSSSRVKGVFTTGTTVSKLTPSSDIDLVILLDKNDEGIKSVYTKIENHFADIFFFDVDFLHQLKDKREVVGNSFDGMFLEWLTKGKIEYDPENLLLEFKNKISENPPLQKVADSEKRDFWIKTNYNFIANSRYYNSGDEFYHKALEFRLLYSISELITAYFSFRDIPWRGEKTAVKYLKQTDQEFLSIFEDYFKSVSLGDKMNCYTRLFDKIFYGEYKKWESDFVVPIANNQNQYDQKLVNFWNNLVEGL